MISTKKKLVLSQKCNTTYCDKAELLEYVNETMAYIYMTSSLNDVLSKGNNQSLIVQIYSIRIADMTTTTDLGYFLDHDRFPWLTELFNCQYELEDDQSDWRLDLGIPFNIQEHHGMNGTYPKIWHLIGLRVE